MKSRQTVPMLNRDLRLALAFWPHVKVMAINPCLDGTVQEYGLHTAIDDGRLEDTPYTIIEAESPNKKSAHAEQIRLGLSRYNPDDEVLIYVPGWEGQNFAYFAIHSISFDVINKRAKIILGDWRYGG